jgi:molybdenum cofactor synthesis domain-containing protein
MKQTTVEIFAIGTELVIGRITDTNSQWMARQIAEQGGAVRRITALTDDLDDIVAALRDSLERGTDLILTSGGLGPTPDDLTVQGVARVLGRGTFVDEATLDDYVRRRNLNSRDEISAGLRKMATVPEGSEVRPNPAGWAPCTFVRHDGGTIVIMPGPPKEMEAVFEMHVTELIAQVSAAKSAALRLVVSMFESEVSPLMQEVMARFPGTYLKAYVAMRDASGQALPVDVVATGEDSHSAHQLLQQAVTFFGELVTARGKTMEYGEEQGP